MPLLSFAFMPKDYRDFLRREYLKRADKNRRYSLRAFAKHIGVTSGYLTDIFKLRKNLSLEKATEVAHRLKLDKKSFKLFYLLVQRELTKDCMMKAEFSKDLRRENLSIERVQLPLDHNKAFARWYIPAILALSSLPGFVLTESSIASKLDLSDCDVVEALDILLSLNLLKIEENGSYTRTPQHLNISSEDPHSVLQDYHSQLLKLATKSLKTQTNKEKFIGSETFCFSPAQIKEANEIINNCLDSLLVLSEMHHPTATDIYTVSVQLFRVSKETS